MSDYEEDYEMNDENDDQNDDFDENAAEDSESAEDFDDDEEIGGGSNDPDPGKTCPNCEIPLRPVQQFLLRRESIRCLHCGAIIPCTSSTGGHK